VSKRRAAIATTSRRPVAGERSLTLDGDTIANLRGKQEEICQRTTQMGHLLHVTHDTKQRVNIMMHIDDLKLAFARVEQQIVTLQQIIVPVPAALTALEFA
jgi:Tfp pilus assembly ATPase PilU